MKNFILIFSSILLIACSASKSASVLPTKKLKINILYGKVVLKSKVSSDGESGIPTLYFDDGDAYFINLTESKVRKTDLEQILFQELEILCEIKKGKTPLKSEYSDKENQSIVEGKYIVIYEIL